MHHFRLQSNFEYKLSIGYVFATLPNGALILDYKVGIIVCLVSISSRYISMMKLICLVLLSWLAGTSSKVVGRRQVPEPSFTNPEEQIREEIEKCVQDMGEKFYPRIAELLRSDEDDTECPNSCYVPETLSDDLIDGFKDSLMGALSNRDLPETCPDSCYTHLGKY